MFENYPYSIKIKALIVLFILLGITAYKRSYSSLILAYKENKSLKEKVENINSKTFSISKLKSEVAGLDRFIGVENVSKEIVQQEVISFVALNSQNISINTVQSIHDYRDADFSIYTIQIDLTGSYLDLSNLVYLFETKFNISKIISLDYFVEKKNNTKDILHLKIILQNYENSK